MIARKKIESIVLTFCLTALTAIIAVGQQPQNQSDRGLKRVEGVESPKPTAKTARLYDESHALVIGVSDYNNGWSPLPGVKKDVEEVSDALREHGFAVQQLINPTREKFDATLLGFIAEHAQAKQNRVLIYFAGHGHTMKMAGGLQGYIVPVNAPSPKKDMAGFIRTTISLSQINTYVESINSKHAMFVFDSCFSGALFTVDRSENLTPAVAFAATQPVRQFITSGTEGQRVPDHSIFREQFIEALKGAADSDGDGYILGQELYFFLYKTVTDLRGGKQTPQASKIDNPRLNKGDFVFVLKNAKPVALQMPLPQTSPPVDTESISGEAALRPSRGGKVLLMITETIEGKTVENGAVARTLQQKLVEAGFSVTLDSELGKTELDQAQKALVASQSGYTKYGEVSPYSIVITGRISSRLQPQSSESRGMQVARASGSLKVTDLRTGGSLASVNISDTRGFGLTAEQANSNALQTAADESAEAVIKRIVK